MKFKEFLKNLFTKRLVIKLLALVLAVFTVVVVYVVAHDDYKPTSSENPEAVVSVVESL